MTDNAFVPGASQEKVCRDKAEAGKGRDMQGYRNFSDRGRGGS